MMTALNVRLDQEMKQALRNKAIADGGRKSDVARVAIEDYLGKIIAEDAIRTDGCRG
jgi:predicted transcriptional regulator